MARKVAEDQAKVLSRDESVTVRGVTQETSRLDPGVVEYKYYAPDVGFILGVMVKGGDERTELVSIGTCSEQNTGPPVTGPASSRETNSSKSRLMDAPAETLTTLAYNVGAFNPSAAELAEMVRAAFPGERGACSQHWQSQRDSERVFQSRPRVRQSVPVVAAQSDLKVRHH